MFTYFGQQMAIATLVSCIAVVAAVALHLGLMATGRGALGRRVMWWTLTLGTLVVIGIFTVAPIGIRSHTDRALVLVPFAGGEYSNVSKQLIVEKIAYNLALFVPLGFCLRFAFSRSVPLCATVGFAVSLVVETLQYVTARGTSTVTDLLLNTLGTILGAALAVLFLILRQRLFSKSSSTISDGQGADAGIRIEDTRTHQNV